MTCRKHAGRRLKGIDAGKPGSWREDHPGPARWPPAGRDLEYRGRDRGVGGHVRGGLRGSVAAGDGQDPGPQAGLGLARFRLARARVADLDRPLARGDVHRQRGGGRQLLLGVERHLRRAARGQALGDLGQRLRGLVPAERDQAAVHHRRTVVGARVEQRVRVDPGVDVHHAQRGRGAGRHVPQGARAHRAVQQDPVARPAVQHRHHPGPAVGHRAERPDVGPGVEDRVQVRALGPGALPVPVDLVRSQRHDH